ncbi:hypothetical protein DOY81_014354, partial [Sarcophaga bullata]
KIVILLRNSTNTIWDLAVMIGKPYNRQVDKQQQQQQVAKNTLTSDWSPLAVVKPNTIANNSSGNVIVNGGSNGGNGGGGGGGLVVGSNNADQLCDNFNGITLNDLASSQNSLGLNIGRNSIVDALVTADSSSSSLVNGVAAAAASATASSAGPATATTPNIFGPQTNPIINIINNNNNCSGQLNNGIDDHDTSFSKNGTEILDFEPNLSNCDSCCNNSSNSVGQLQSQQQLGYASILMNNCTTDHLDITRWSLDSKFAALKTRRSNSLTTQTISSSASSSNSSVITTISSSASSSNSSVITVNDNCSNSTENLAQFVNKPRSYSLSAIHTMVVAAHSGSDTFRRFQTQLY